VRPSWYGPIILRVDNGQGRIKGYAANNITDGLSSQFVLAVLGQINASRRTPLKDGWHVARWQVNVAAATAAAAAAFTGAVITSQMTMNHNVKHISIYRTKAAKV